jgi:signal transduction histidine kinase
LARSSAAWVLVLGMLASALLFAIVQFQIRGRGEAEERERRQKLLAEAGRLLSQSLHTEETLSRVAGICVQSLADWCAVHLLGDGGELRTAALAHRDPDRVRWAREMGGHFPLGAGVAHQLETVIHSGAPVLASDARDGLAGALAQSASYLCVPLVARGQALGALTLVSSVPGRYDAGDLATAQEVAQLAAAAVDNARQYQRAQEAARIRDEFLSVASHELKTPLTSLVLKLEALRRLASAEGADVPVRRARAHEVLDRQTGRLVRLVESLLDISRLAAGRLRLELSDVDLSEVTREVAYTAGEEIALAGCTLELDADVAVVGRWDRMRVEQVISNLLSNAVKYGRGRPIHLSVRARDGKGRLVMRDEGFGLAPEDLNRVFERFERVVPAANYGGLGLGLYIAKQIVEAMGGRISVESKAGQGSTFAVELPLSGPQGAASPGEGAASALQRLPAARRGAA